MTKYFDRVLSDIGITINQFFVLKVITENPHKTITALSNMLDMDRTTISRNLIPLKRDGLITIEKSGDLRSNFCRITNLGLSILDSSKVALYASEFEYSKLDSLKTHLNLIHSISQELLS